MKNLYLGFQHFLNDEEGVTAIEYGLIAALIAVVIIAAVSATGKGVCATFKTVAEKLGGDVTAVSC
ncbi:Flp/Fap pilin component [mine drainage metagenome]|uniref:Flp/Fap pilin component n=1 Tax=mine drainage metagenome TaxID=410659 RepID=A0A1J5TZY3_9ZZZZ